MDNVGYLLNNMQVMGCRDDRLARAMAVQQNIDYVSCSLGVKADGRLIQEQDFRVDRKDGGYRDLLFLAYA